jgi:hypothetical protein
MHARFLPIRTEKVIRCKVIELEEQSPASIGVI